MSMFVFTYAARPHKTLTALNKYNFRMGSCNVTYICIAKAT